MKKLLGLALALLLLAVMLPGSPRWLTPRLPVGWAMSILKAHKQSTIILPMVAHPMLKPRLMGSFLLIQR